MSYKQLRGYSNQFTSQPQSKQYKQQLKPLMQDSQDEEDSDRSDISAHHFSHSRDLGNVSYEQQDSSRHNLNIEQFKSPVTDYKSDKYPTSSSYMIEGLSHQNRLESDQINVQENYDFNKSMRSIKSDNSNRSSQNIKTKYQDNTMFENLVREKKKKFNLNLDSTDRANSNNSSNLNTQELKNIKKYTTEDYDVKEVHGDTDELRISANDDKFAVRYDAKNLQNELGSVERGQNNYNYVSNNSKQNNSFKNLSHEDVSINDLIPNFDSLNSNMQDPVRAKTPSNVTPLDFKQLKNKNEEVLSPEDYEVTYKSTEKDKDMFRSETRGSQRSDERLDYSPFETNRYDLDRSEKSEFKTSSANYQSTEKSEKFNMRYTTGAKNFNREYELNKNTEIPSSSSVRVSQEYIKKEPQSEILYSQYSKLDSKEDISSDRRRGLDMDDLRISDKYANNLVSPTVQSIEDNVIKESNIMLDTNDHKINLETGTKTSSEKIPLDYNLTGEFKTFQKTFNTFKDTSNNYNSTNYGLLNSYNNQNNIYDEWKNTNKRIKHMIATNPDSYQVRFGNLVNRLTMKYLKKDDKNLSMNNPSLTFQLKKKKVNTQSNIGTTTLNSLYGDFKTINESKLNNSLKNTDIYLKVAEMSNVGIRDK